MGKNSLAKLYFLIHDHFLHHIRDCDRQLVRPRMAKDDGKGGLVIGNSRSLNVITADTVMQAINDSTIG